MRNLKSLHTFHIAAQSQTLTEAATKLHITHGAVSKQIKRLEEELGQALFRKAGRKLTLTLAGQVLLQHTQRAFADLSIGLDKVKQQQTHVIDLSCEPTLTMRWLMPRLSNFHNLGETEVRLSTAGGPVVLGAQGHDLAIRRNDFSIPQHYVQQPLVDEWVGPVLSPSYWQRILQDPRKMKRLHSDTRQYAWRDWQRSHSEHHSSPLLFDAEQQTFAHFYFCLQAAVDGLGAAIGSFPLVADDIERGNLIAPFGFYRSGFQYVLLSLDAIEPPSASALFATWLQNEFQSLIPASTLSHH
ncbi:LysR family transcriptional regulator [Thaumasiovibrio subtropicus]|uniref:LysR family transcriptional regulator n=1 Tax=Thaumasiovibrio subtropicus TaxID=1891207 RepID=UPI000B34F53F|nr:LysR family transcriptional regulator [Thaumasiovibrio subtropicus]